MQLSLIQLIPDLPEDGGGGPLRAIMLYNQAQAEAEVSWMALVRFSQLPQCFVSLAATVRRCTQEHRRFSEAGWDSVDDISP